MDKAHPLSYPMVVYSLNVKNDSFRPCENCEKLLGPEVPYLSTRGGNSGEQVGPGQIWLGFFEPIK